MPGFCSLIIVSIIASEKEILIREECGGKMCFCKVRLKHFLLQESF